MDTDLFQILALILLLGLLLTLFGVLQSLGAIRKTLEQRGAEPAASATPAPQRAAGEEPATWARPSDSGPAATEAGDAGWGGASRTGWPAPQEAGAGTSTALGDEPATALGDEPATSLGDEPGGIATGSAGSGARVLYGDSGLTTATPNESALRPAETAEREPDTTAAASAGTAGSEIAGATGFEGGTTGVGASTTDTTAGTSGAGAVTDSAGAAEDPQEQPFERDGRWWFRRGDELLVYEEQTGQWVPAEQPSTSGSVAAPVAATGGETVEGAAEGQVTAQQETAGSFWKCPSCGAVNGSTATSCRMCFTARP